MFFPIAFGDDKDPKNLVPAKPRAYNDFACTNDSRVRIFRATLMGRWSGHEPSEKDHNSYSPACGGEPNEFTTIPMVHRQTKRSIIRSQNIWVTQLG
jgi:hypothetical protein